MSRKLARTITRLVRSLCAADRGSQTRIAGLLGIDRTTVAHWLVEDGERDYYVPADALAAICDALDTVAPLQAIADELGHEVVPKSRPTTAPEAITTGSMRLMGYVSRLGLEVEKRAADGSICEHDSAVLGAHLDALIATAQAMRARLARPA